MLNIFSPLLDIIFPKHCLVCMDEGKYICDKCFSRIHLKRHQECPSCFEKSADGRYCASCEAVSPLQGIIVLGHYENKILQEAIQTFKYQFIRELGVELSSLYLENKFLKQLGGKKRDWIIIPVPLHKRRFLKRGFNQSEVLADQLAENSKVDCISNNLIRVKNTPSQVELGDKAKRLENVCNAFEVLDRKIIAKKKIVLVDDVCTTSATLDECARTLKKAGAREVWGLVLARGG